MSSAAYQSSYRYLKTASKLLKDDSWQTHSEHMFSIYSEMAKAVLKDPEDYIKSCREGLARSAPELTVESMVTSGHHIRVYRSLIEEHEVDLLVMNTKDEDQLAMHGLAYPLAIELRAIPLLML